MKFSKKALSDEERLVSTIQDFKEQILARQKNLIYVTVAVLSVLLLVIGGWIYVKSSKSRAAEFEAEGYRYFYSAQESNAQEMFTKALESFKRAYETKKGAYSLFYIANCYESLGRLEDALKSLNELADAFSEPLVLSLAYNKMAAVYINKGDSQRALESLDKLKKIKGASLQDLAYMQSAALLEAMGKTEEAKAQYRELTEKFPGSIFTAVAKAKTTK